MACYNYRILKRLFDLIAGSVCLLVVFPLILIIALLIVIDSRGNPFFYQYRTGEKGIPFVLFKFRTLYVHKFGIFLHEELAFNDPRVTPIGKYLRATKLDEIPQLLNIILGQMSFVGPRPDLPIQVAGYSETQKKRLTVKPGLTGLAQIMGNTNLTWNERIILDLWYIERWSFWLDMKIIFLTPVSVITDNFYEAFPLKFSLLKNKLELKRKSVP